MAENRGLSLSGKVTGIAELGSKMDFAPRLFRGTAIAQLKRERNLFVGKRGGGEGVFTKKIMRKKISSDRSPGGTWSKKVAKLFRGKVTVGSAERAEDIKLGMGLFFNSDKDIFRALEFLQTGGTVTTSGLMLVPIYNNLRRAGVTMKTGGAKFGSGSHAGNVVRAMIKADNLVTIRRGGKVYFYNKILMAANSSYSLFFVGVKKITVKKQFDFVADWVRREPKAINRLQKAMDRGVVKFNKMKKPK